MVHTSLNDSDSENFIIVTNVYVTTFKQKAIACSYIQPIRLINDCIYQTLFVWLMTYNRFNNTHATFEEKLLIYDV